MKRRMTGLTALVSTAVLLLGACGTGNGGTTAAPTTPAATPGTVAPPAGGTDAGTDAPGGTGACPADTPLNIGLVVQGQNNVRTDNPWLPTSTGQLLQYNRLRLEPLAVINRLNTDQITPWLASDYSWNDDYTAVTFTARDGVTWNDGTPFTADDIAATFMTTRDTTVDGAYTLDPQRIIGDVDVNGNQVTIHFNRPRLTDWTNVLQIVIMQKAYLDTLTPEQIMTGDLNDLKYTGPYDVTSFTPGNVRMDRRDDYWGGQGQNQGLPAPATINLVSYNDNNALENALVAGQVQWSQSPMTNPQAFIDANPGYNVWWTPSDIQIEMMYLNNHEGAFADPAFRKAANLAINRTAWRDISYQGQGTLLDSATGLVLPAGETYKNPALAGATLGGPTGDPDAARQVLIDAGYTHVGEAGALLDPQGNPVVLSISAPSDWNDYVSSGAMIAQNLSNVLGAQATFDAQDVDSWWEARSLGNFDAAQRAAGTTGVGPFWLYRDMIAQRGMGGVAEMGEAGDWNLGRYWNDDVQAAFNTMQTSPDAAAREQALFDIQNAMATDFPVLLLGGRPIFSAYNTSCFVNWPSNENPYTPAQVIQPGTMLMVVTSLKPR